MPEYKSKKRVTRSDSDSDSDEGSRRTKQTKKPRTAEAKDALPGGGLRDANGDAFWEIADKRRLTVSEFKGKMMVSVREYYEKDGQVLPGKKGITLPVNQFAALINSLPAVEHVLKQRGEKLPRPDYEKLSKDTTADDDEDFAGEQISSKGERKRNFEETSEEE